MLFGLSFMSLLTLLSPTITSAGGYRALFATRVLGGMAAVRKAALTRNTKCLLSAKMPKTLAYFLNMIMLKIGRD